MKIVSTELVMSAVRCSQYPTDRRSEILLVGRSNVGKSSFINRIIGRKSYARTSSTPGKTQTINFYLVNNKFYLVDAPGYGYTKLSKENHNKFGLMMEEYLKGRDNLKQVFMLVDFRHKPSKDDVMMYEFLKFYKIPVTIVATKADKITKSNYQKQKNIILQELNLTTEDDFIIFSSVTKEGKSEILDKIDRII
jgi:GTP-binding protein